MNVLIAPLSDDTSSRAEWELCLEDRTDLVSLGTYTRKADALRAGSRLLESGPETAAVAITDVATSEFDASVTFRSGATVPVGTYRRRETAERGIGRFLTRLADAEGVITVDESL